MSRLSDDYTPATGSAGTSALSGLTDVALVSVADTQVLTYDAASGKWKNATPAAGGVTSFNTRTGAITLSKTDVTATGLAKGDVGLGNVDNTSDVNKPVSTAQAAADTAVQAASAQKSANLSDLASAATARTNLGLATVAATGAYADLTGKPTIPTALTVVTKTAAYSAANGDVILANGASRSVTDGVTTSGSTTITSATAAFVAGDVGRAVYGSGIPISATIASVTNSTTAVLSAAATATATSVKLNFDGRFTITITPTASGHWYVKKVDTDPFGGPITVTPASGTIEGVASLILNQPEQAAEVFSDGTNLQVA